MYSSRSSSEQSAVDTGRNQEIRHLSRHRSNSSSLMSDRPIYLARKEEQISTGDLYDDIEYDSDDERFMMELKAKRTPLQEALSKARRIFGAFSACILILAACLLVMYGLPRYISAKTTAAWEQYQDPRMKTGMGKTINSNWKDPHSGQQ